APRVEEHVLDRMERLRGFQLTHADAVTDAMNLLARALVTLTDPALKREYDAGLGMGTPLELAATSAISSVAAGFSPRESESRGLKPAATEEMAEVVTEGAPPVPTTRRALYRRRVALRRLRTTWEEIGRCLGDADRPFASRTEVVELIQNLGMLGLLTAADGAPLR